MKKTLFLATLLVSSLAMAQDALENLGKGSSEKDTENSNVYSRVKGYEISLYEDKNGSADSRSDYKSMNKNYHVKNLSLTIRTPSVSSDQFRPAGQGILFNNGKIKWSFAYKTRIDGSLLVTVDDEYRHGIELISESFKINDSSSEFSLDEDFSKVNRFVLDKTIGLTLEIKVMTTDPGANYVDPEEASHPSK